MKNRKLGVITDFDNTLVDTWSFIERHIKHTCDRLQMPTPKNSDILSILKTNPPFEQIFRNLFKDNADKVLAAYREDAMDTDYTPTNGALELLKKLSENKAMTIIVSNRTRKLLDRLEQAGFKQAWFHAILQAVEPKPSPKAYEEALGHFTQHNISSYDTYVLGDSLDDYQACPKNIKNNFFAVTTGPNTQADFIKAGVAKQNILKDLTGINQKIFYGRN